MSGVCWMCLPLLRPVPLLLLPAWSARRCREGLSELLGCLLLPLLLWLLPMLCVDELAPSRCSRL